MIARPSGNRGPFDFGASDLSPDMAQRVIVTGANGAGKSWLTLRIGKMLAHGVIHKDALALRTHWKQRSKDEVNAALAEMLLRDRWVLDTGPTGLTRAALERSTLVIWLDPPAWLRFWRVLRRTLRYLGRTRPEHPPGNRDWPGRRQLRFLTGTIRNRHAFDAALSEALTNAPVPVLRLKKPRDVKALLACLKASRQRTEPF